MPAELLDGRAIAQRVRDRVAGEVTALGARGITPGLAVVLVGDDPASEIYVRAKRKACAETRMHSVTVDLASDTSQAELLDRLDALNRDAAVHGILVQMPLPPQIQSDVVLRAVDPAKDVDGFHPINVGKLLSGDRGGFVPCTPAAIQYLLRESNVTICGSDCVIVGRSNIVGKPLAALLMQDTEGANATVTVCHRHTVDLAAHTRRADILVSAAGRAGMITREMVKPGAVVVDVGVTRVRDESAKGGWRVAGDVDFAGVSEVASRITPVPGGVGPMTIAMLLDNTVRAARRSLDA